jgi:hypothetical protein
MHDAGEGLNVAANRTQAVTGMECDLIVSLSPQPAPHDLSLVRLSPADALHIAPRRYLESLPLEVSTVPLDRADGNVKHVRQILLCGYCALIQGFVRQSQDAGLAQSSTTMLLQYFPVFQPCVDRPTDFCQWRLC